MRWIGAIVVLISMVGCGTAQVALNYTPSSLVQGKGTIQVQPLAYDPALSGKVKDDQIKNTAIGDIRLGRPVGDYVTQAFASEFKYAGYTLDNSKNFITGEIEQFEADDLGFSVDWTLKMTVVLKSHSGKVLANKNIEVKKKLTKFGEFSVAVNMVIKEAFEQMMSDPKFKKLIR